MAEGAGNALFRTSPFLSDRINGNLIQSEIEGGVFLTELPAGTRLEVRTQNSTYTIVLTSPEEGWISGHSHFCPEPVRVKLVGCTWGGSLVKTAFLGRGMHLEFLHPGFKGPILTSRILEIHHHRPPGPATC